MSEWTDKVQAVSSIASLFISLGSTALVVFTLKQTTGALKNQNQSNDTSTVLSIWEKIDDHWIRFRNASDNDKNFEFGQLISYYEMVCHLFRSESFKTKSSDTLFRHLHDILSFISSNKDMKAMLDELKSHPDNCENILWLCSQSRLLFSEK